MVIVNAYIGDGNFSNIRLSMDIKRSGNNTVVDTDKLEKTLNKKRSENPSVIGIYDWEEGLLVFNNNNSFTGVVWMTRESLRGTWEAY